MKENDQPFSSQWEDWSVSDLDGGTHYVKGFISTGEAIEKIKPSCPSCGQKLTIENLD